MNNFKYALVLAHQLYGLEMTEDDFEEIALVAWNHIGNKRYKLNKITATINCDTLSVELPCDVTLIEAVTANFEDWKTTSNLHDNGDLNSQFVEHYIERDKYYTNPLYISGKYIPFRQSGDTLFFDKNYGDVNILYKSEILDQDGLPEITDKEAYAIAAYCAYTQKYKEGLITNNSNILTVANMLKAEYNKFVDAARVPEYINQNDMNSILDTKTRYDRKIYNKKYTPVL